MAREFYSSAEIISSNNPTTSNIHHHHQQHDEMVNQIQGYDEASPSDHRHHQIFSLNTNLGVIDFSKHHHHQISNMTSGLEERSGGGENLLLEDSSSSMRCVGGSVFPCEVNERRPCQGLSLSLSSSNPTTISLQAFELRPQTQQDHHHHVVVGSARQGYFGKSDHQHTQMLMMMTNNNYHQFHHHHHHHHHNQTFHIASSKYLAPAQDLLNEFCSLGNKQGDEEIKMTKQKSLQKGKQQQRESQNNSNTDHDPSASTSSMKHVPPLHSLEFMELQKRKTKLLSMLEELDRRYRHYCEQMRAAASAFEAAAGVGAAASYTALASKAMSRHFRCLRDGVVGQIQATRKAMGEKDPAAPGTTRGETPRLRLLDQAFRQQKAYQQMSLMETHPWRPQRGLPERAISILRAWLFEHFLHPYPSDVDKHILARQTSLSRSQVSNWFINARVRLWKPMIEEMYLEETREELGNNNVIINNNNNASSSSDHHHRVSEDNSIINPMIVDPKTEPNQLIRIDPDSLSSIITNPSSKNDPRTAPHHHHGTTSFGSTFDFPTYGHQQAVTYACDSVSQGFNGGKGGVSLTLGLQQHDGNGGVSLAFSPVAAAGQGGPIFYGRDHMEDCQQGVQYASMLDGDQAQNLPYRNLMGAQLIASSTWFN